MVKFPKPRKIVMLIQGIKSVDITVDCAFATPEYGIEVIETIEKHLAIVKETLKEEIKAKENV